MLYKSKAEPGIPSRDCHCGARVFALPFDDKLETWKTLNASRYRQKFIDAGILPPEPPRPQPYVILLDTIDRDLFKLRRWRVVRSPPGKLNKFEVAGSVKGRRLHRMLLPDAEVIRIVNRNGCDVRRENLEATTMRAVCQKRRPAVKPAP